MGVCVFGYQCHQQKHCGRAAQWLLVTVAVTVKVERVDG